MDPEKILKRLDDVIDNKNFDVKEFSNVASDINKQLENMYGKEMMDRARNSPSNLGLDAGLEGKEITTNPFRWDSEDYDEWSLGYKEGRKLREQKKAQ